VRVFFSGTPTESFGNIGTYRTRRSQDLIGDYVGSHALGEPANVSNNDQKKLMGLLPDDEIFEAANLSHGQFKRYYPLITSR
jgi:hypothetical protein